jgi:hypothetical protein
MVFCKEGAEFYGVGYSAISKKLKKLFASDEMNKKQVSAILIHKADDGELYCIIYYNSQVIYEVGTILKSQEYENLRSGLLRKIKAYFSFGDGRSCK